jgi:hypothetical protein
MTPKEKAKELTYRFYRIIPLDKMTIDYNLAKKCALIAVDELIEATSVKYEYNSDFELKITGKKPLQYWLDVKQEIEKL